MTRFEKITGIKNAGDIGELKGLLAASRAAGLTVAIVRIPVYLLAIDTRYQTPIRTERDLDYLTIKWDERKLLPLTGVPHDEEGLVYLTDGSGRWIASQLVDPEKYQALDVMVILNAPQDPEARLIMEAELYAYQNRDVALLKPIEKHGAMKVLGSKAPYIIDEMKEKYGFTFKQEKGNRSPSVIGSYTDILKIAKQSYGEECLDYVFNICKGAGFNKKPNGYSRYILNSIRDMWIWYPENRKNISEYLEKRLRGYAPIIFKTQAQAKYPMLNYEAACSLYIEDLVVEGLGLEHSRIINEKNKVMPIQKAS